MKLSTEELMAFIADGAVVRRGFVGRRLVDRARVLIDQWYRGMDIENLATYTQRTFAPDLGRHPDLLALFSSSGIIGLVASLLDEFRPVDTAQIQIRVPEKDFAAAQPEKPMHVDGVACPHLDPEELRTFSLLVGVVLSDVTDSRGGVLRYVRGGHMRMAEWFRSEWSLGLTEQTPPQIEAEHGVPFLGRPGDVLFMHHLVPHSVGRNYTEEPRVMVYFRVSHIDHATRRLEALRDPWADYPAIALLQQATELHEC